MHRYNPVNVTENFKPANEVKEEKAPVVASPVPAAEEPYKINITVSKDDVKEKPAEVKAPPPPQPDLPLEEPAPKSKPSPKEDVPKKEEVAAPEPVFEDPKPVTKQLKPKNEVKPAPITPTKEEAMKKPVVVPTKKVVPT